jgi:murein DD-endopeptidase / murein LD-carboxypeptidase
MLWIKPLFLRPSIFILKKTYMVRTLIVSFGLLGLAGFSPVSAQKSKQSTSQASKSEVKFLNDILFELPGSPPEQIAKTTESGAAPTIRESSSGLSIEKVSKLQFKYAILLDAEVEQVHNIGLFENIDNWFGTRYRYGGTTKGGIDCSAFVQVLFSSHYNIGMPRTAQNQYDATLRIAREELKEGDLIFFNTRGGVSHVGIYLQNNKFVHASTSEGVTITDLEDSYWSRRIVGFGRYVKPQENTLAMVVL